MGLVFGSQAVQLPGVLTQVNPQGLSPVTAGAPNNIAFIGTGLGTQPQTVQEWSDPAAVQALRGGDLLNAVNFAFSPAVGGGATTQYTVRVNRATQATLALPGASAATAVLLTSADYGAWTNGIQVSIAAGSLSNTVIASVQYAPGNYLLVSPNLGQALQLAYTGNATAATVTLTDSLATPAAPTLTQSTGGALASGDTVYVVVTAVNASGESLPSTSTSVTLTANNSSVQVAGATVTGATRYNIYAGSTATALYLQQTITAFPATLTALVSSGTPPPTTNTTGPDITTTLTGATDGSQSLDWSLSVSPYNTLQGLVNAFNGQTGYTASTLGMPSMPSSYLDTVTAANITTAEILTAQQGAVLYWFNTQASNYVTAAAGAGSTQPPAPTAGFLYLSGGSEGPAPQLSDWQDALSLLESYNIDIVVPLTSEGSIHALFDQTNHSLAQQGVIYRTGFYGGATGETPAITLGRAQALNSDRAVLAAPGFYQNDYTGTYTLFPPYMLAALYAGIAAGLNVSVPLTYKQPNILALEQLYNQSTQIQLIQGGVAPTVAVRTGGFRIEQGVTTSLSNTSVYNVEYSVLRAVDYVREQLSLTFDGLVGQASQGSVTVAQMVAEATAVLNAAVANGIIAGFQTVTNVAVSSQSPTAYVVPVNIQVVDPINNILVTINLAA